MRWFASLAVVLVSATVALADSKPVIVAPFTESNEQQQPDWISRSLHQSLVDDVAAIPDVTVLNASKPASPSDAKYIIRATIQRGGNGELRISGRIEEVATGKTIGGFKAGGLERQLFAIEDSIADQVRATLGGNDDPAYAQQQQRQQVTQPAPPQPQQPVMVADGVFEGSDLQRALLDRDYVRREAIRGSVPDYDMNGGGYGYQQPLYPYTVGLNGNYGYPGWGGWGWGGWGWGGSVIIINKGRGHHGGDGHHGGGGGSWHGRTSQQLRNAAVFGRGFSGQANMVANPTSGQVRPVGGFGRGGGGGAMNVSGGFGGRGGGGGAMNVAGGGGRGGGGRGR
jgi:TolB-like protein